MTSYDTSDGTTKPAPTPGKRVLRTAVQIVVGVAGVTPAAVQLLEEAGVDFDGPLYVAVAGCATLLVTAIWNGIEETRGSA